MVMVVMCPNLKEWKSEYPFSTFKIVKLQAAIRVTIALITTQN